MKTTKRFENAVTKLYNAFHNGELELEDCTRCAVGNMLNNSNGWYAVINTKKVGGLFSESINRSKNGNYRDIRYETKRLFS